MRRVSARPGRRRPLVGSPSVPYSEERAGDERRGAPPRPRLSAGALMVPVGVAVTLIGLIGDLLAHTLNPSSHAHETLIVLGRGNSPWHLLLLAGILLTAVGGIRWVASFRTQLAEVMAAWLALLLVAVIALGGWYGWTAGHEPVALTSASGHVHTTLASGPATTGGHSGHTSVSSQVPGTSDEGQAAFGHQHGTPGPTTPAEAEQRDQMLAQAKAATAKFQDISVAKAAGYRQVTQFIPGLGLHLVNLKLSDQVFDPAHPQVLLYEPDGTGGYTLVGVSYLSRHTTETPPAGFPGGGDVWHYHQNLCFLGDGSVTIAPSASACASKHGYFQAQTDWMLHVWIWRTNPNGVFTEFNPAVF